MTGRQRVENAIAHKMSDRYPLAYEGSYEVTKALVEYFGIDKLPVPENETAVLFHSPIGEKSVSPYHMRQLQKKLGVDQNIVACPTNPQRTIGNWFGLPLTSFNADGTILGAWGINFIEVEYPTGKYIELHSAPLEGVEDLDALIAHPSPDLDLYDYKALRGAMLECEDNYILLNMNGCFDFARFMRGTEQFLIDMALEPEKVEVLLDKVNDFAMDYLDAAMAEVKGIPQGVYCGDDFGSQRGLVMSPDMWRQFIKPRYKKLIDKVKSYGLTYYHHSCGGIRPIIGDLIELGVDVLNPIQPLADGMEPDQLADEFGRDITFYGAIDEQQTLPFGSAEDVRAEVRDRIATLGRYGGYIVSPSHGFQSDTPIENILAMYEEVLGHKIT